MNKRSAQYQLNIGHQNNPVEEYGVIPILQIRVKDFESLLNQCLADLGKTITVDELNCECITMDADGLIKLWDCQPKLSTDGSEWNRPRENLGCVPDWYIKINNIAVTNPEDCKWGN